MNPKTHEDLESSWVYPRAKTQNAPAKLITGAFAYFLLGH